MKVYRSHRLHDRLDHHGNNCRSSPSKENAAQAELTLRCGFRMKPAPIRIPMPKRENAASLEELAELAGDSSSSDAENSASTVPSSESIGESCWSCDEVDECCSLSTVVFSGASSVSD